MVKYCKGPRIIEEDCLKRVENDVEATEGNSCVNSIWIVIR